MKSGKTNNKKLTKKVLVQPNNVNWPFIDGDDFIECTQHLIQVERKYIVTGCNAVIKLLQDGQAAALFIHNSFHPKVFAKIIMKMACKRNAALLTLALPSLPDQGKTGDTMMAISNRPVGVEKSSAVENLLSWMKHLSLEKKFITAKSLRRTITKAAPKETKKKRKKQPDRPMTEAEVAKLYVLEPAADGGASNKHSEESAAFGTTDFISFSSRDSRVTIETKPDTAPQQKLFDRKPKKGGYIPLTVNKVQGNPNRVKHKKKRS